MPPKPKVYRQDIVDAAVEWVQAEGIDTLNARGLAKLMGCSTQPIFSSFSTMGELREAVAQQVTDFFETFLAQHTQPERVLISTSMAYIEFARQQPHFFRMLFLSGEFGSPDVYRRCDRDPAVIRNIVETAGIDEYEARDLFLHVWIFVHGLATLLVCGQPLQAEYLDTLIQDAVIGFYRLYS